MFEEISTETLKYIREDLLQQTIDQLFSVVRSMHREVLHQEPGLSHPQARLVFAIAKHKSEGVSVKELARIAGITPGAITQFVDGLIEKELVKREEDPDDRRIVRLKLTPAAKSQMEIFRKEFLASASRMFNVLSTDELRQCKDLLARVSAQVSDHDCQPKIY